VARSGLLRDKQVAGTRERFLLPRRLTQWRYARAVIRQKKKWLVAYSGPPRLSQAKS